MPRPDAYVLECAFASSPDDLLKDQVWTDITRYFDVRTGARINRGRTDEFSEIQASTLALTLRNDGRFTTDNPASPYYPNVKTGKRIRFGLLRKGNAKQIDPNPSFGGTPPFAGTNALCPWESKPGLAVTTLAASTTFAQDGAQSMRLTLPTAGAAGAIVRKFVYGLVAGQQYTASAYLRVPAGVPQMVFGCTPGSTAATTVNDAFQRRTITFTATGPSCELYVYNNAGATAGQFVYLDAVQVESGAAATVFEPTAAVFSWRFTGEVNEWPTGWEGGPAVYAESMVTATDQFKRLGELGELLSTLDEDILDDVPFAYYPLNEPAGVASSTASAGDISGNDETPLTVRQTGGGGAITFGSEPGVPDFYVGKRTTVAINPASAGNGMFLRATLKKPPTVLTPAGACVNIFTQESVSPLSTGPLAIITGKDGSWFGVRKAGSGNITAAFYDATTDILSEVISGVGMSSSASRMFSAILDVPSAGNGRITFYINGVAFGTPVTFAMAQVPTWAVVSVGGRASELFRGYLSHAAFFNWAVGSGALGGWFYSAYRGTDGAGSTSYARLNKLCVYTSLETPLAWAGESFTPQPVGPQEIEGQPLTAMRLVEATEDGQFFIKGDGRSLLRLRNYRYNADPLLTVESERLDPEAVSFRGDDFGIVNDATVTRSDGATARMVNKASKADHGRRKDTRDAIAVTDDALRDLAAWQVNSWGVQRNRITGVKISLLNDPSVIATALQVDIGSKLRINSLPAQAPTPSVDLFVEGWAETVSEAEWSLAFNTSPAEMYDVWQIGVPGHSEIGLTTKIGH